MDESAERKEYGESGSVLIIEWFMDDPTKPHV
jgi:hypothetical protein